MKKEFNYNETLNRFNEKDSGKFGKALEINVKHYLNGMRGNADKVSAKGKIDVINKGVKYEIKSNCGEINDNILHNDFIIYSYDNESDWNRPENCHVIPTDEFIAIIEKLGLKRTKKSTNGQLKVTIQSYKNSKRKNALWCMAISEYPTLASIAR